MSLNPKCMEKTPGRIAVPGLVIQLSGFEGAFPLLSISASGFSIKASEGEHMRSGQETVAEIMSVSQKKILRCSARLFEVNPDKEAVSFEFINLNPLQKALLDKLLLQSASRETD